MKDRESLVYIVALAAVAIVALFVGLALDSGNQRSGTIAVATACVTAIALLARRSR